MNMHVDVDGSLRLRSMDWNAAWLSNITVTPNEPAGVHVSSTAISTSRCLVLQLYNKSIQASVIKHNHT